MQTHSDLIGTAEACEILGKDRATVTRWVEKGKLTSHKMPGRTGAHLFDRQEVEALRDQDESIEAAS
jgi:excisionase family DNA binding protein